MISNMVFCTISHKEGDNKYLVFTEVRRNTIKVSNTSAKTSTKKNREPAGIKQEEDAL